MNTIEVEGTFASPTEWKMKQLRNNLRTAEEARDKYKAQLDLITTEAEELRMELRLAKGSSRKKD